MKRSWYINIGDNHAGHRNGLIAPKTALEWGVDDIREPEISGWSDWLWHEVWLAGLEYVKSMAGKEPVYVLHSGDITHGSRYVDNHYTPFVSEQVKIAIKSFEPVRELDGYAGFALVSGTGSHDYGGNSASLMCRDEIAKWGYPVWYNEHILVDFDGFRADLAHHGSFVSRLDHLKPNSARRDFMQLMSHDLQWGRNSAHLYQRGHVHTPVDTIAEVVWQNQTRRARVLITPPMTGPNGYARQAVKSMQEVTCGFYLTCVEGDQVKVFPWLKNRDTRDHIRVSVSVPDVKRRTRLFGKKDK